MREIKFRVWDGKIMYYNPYIPNHGKWAMLDETIKDCQDSYQALMQFTGLLDKNDKEIYEGDVLRGISNNPFSMGEKRSYEVIWGIDSWHIKGTFMNMQELQNYCNNNIEIIGNIYENPELLKL